ARRRCPRRTCRSPSGRRSSRPASRSPVRTDGEGRGVTHVLGLLIALGVVLLLLLILLPQALRVVREYQRLVVFRLGRSIGLKGPGLVILIPVIDKPVWVDLRELYLEIPHQTAITKDNAPISIDFIIFYKVVDASMSVLSVG